MRPLLFFASAFLLWPSCGTETSGEIDLEMIRDRLDRNACRIVREDLAFEIGELEFIEDSTFSAIPVDILEDSLLACPVTGEPFTMENEDGDRWILCPSGHGRTEL